MLAFPAFLLLMITYLVLALALIGQLYFAFREKLKDRHRLFGIALLIAVLLLTFLFPTGLINFDRLEGEDLLVAEREGVANCMTTLKLKEHNKFIEREVCFGVTETKGHYELKNDTIFFANASLGRDGSDYYKFAVIKPSNSNNGKILGALIRYKGIDDTSANALGIIKNDLIK